MMSTSRIITVILAALMIGAFLYLRSAGKTDGASARELVAKGAKLVDVRTPDEFGDGHIEGAINIPVSDIEARHGELGDKGAPIVVYCASGMRSAGAKSKLVKLGFSDVHDVGAMSRY